MSLFLQIMISTWIISTICVIIGYTSALSNRDFTGLINAINKSETLNLFGKIFSNLLSGFLFPFCLEKYNYSTATDFPGRGWKGRY